MFRLGLGEGRIPGEGILRSDQRSNGVEDGGIGWDAAGLKGHEDYSSWADFGIDAMTAGEATMATKTRAIKKSCMSILSRDPLNSPPVGGSLGNAIQALMKFVSNVTLHYLGDEVQKKVLFSRNWWDCLEGQAGWKGKSRFFTSFRMARRV